ncbi:MAG: metal ABC transporter ATP-binding protein [Oscillospiraceae bacterium]|nr:metal ABC transporter ATP-binding protein [Oscillospiraceae bacterium]
MDKPPVLEASFLFFKYGDETLLGGVNFKVMPGDFVAVTGSNGAGKSTLFRLILNELSPASGGIFLFGEDLKHFKGWPRIGYVQQANPAYTSSFPATVEEVVLSNLYSRIGLFRPVRKVHRKSVLGALRLVGMSQLKNRMISELSGGQLQRVMVARALVSGCELLLLDEPVTGIDAEAAESLYELLHKINRDGVTIFMVTHDIGRCAKYVSRVLCLEDGTIVELNREQLERELLNKHRHR